MEKIAFDLMGFRVLYLLSARVNLDVSRCKSLPKTIITSTWRL